MFLAEESRQRLEAFLRGYTGDAALRLPQIFLYRGRLARWLTRTFRIGAITFGRRIFVASNFIERDERGRLTITGWLVAHEAVHVLQYERAGYVGFFWSYLRGYFRALRSQKKWNRAAHAAAYLAIKEEREAHAAEKAYRERRND